jgi:hypothetical protein
MTVLTPDDLPSLELMAQLRDRVKTPNSRPIAAPTTPSAPSHSLTLTENLLTLAAKLRTVGFAKYADNLEQHFALYKAAVVQGPLYRAHLETGPELIEFAHPDGDVEMAEAKDHMGDVETIVSRHQKMLDVAKQKMPRKTAQAEPVDPTKQQINFTQAQEPQPAPTPPNTPPARDLVDPSSVGKLFAYMSKFIQDNILSKVPEDINTLPPAQQNYYAYASKYFELGQKLTLTFNVETPTPAEQVLKIINDNLQGEKIAAFDQIKTFIDTKLTWLTDNSPIKLASIIDMVKQALTKEAIWNPIAAAIIYELWTHTNRLNEGIKNNASILSEELNKIKTIDPVRTRANLLRLINTVQSALDKALPQWLEAFNEAQDDPGAKKKTIDEYSTRLKTLSKVISRLDREMQEIRNEEGVGGKVYHTLVASPFQDVQKAIGGLQEAITDQNAAVATARAKMSEVVGKEDLSEISTDTDSSGENLGPIGLAHAKSQEVARLNQLKETVLKKHPEHSDYISKAFDGEIKAVAAAPDMETLQKKINENQKLPDWMN